VRSNNQWTDNEAQPQQKEVLRKVWISILTGRFTSSQAALLVSAQLWCTISHGTMAAQSSPISMTRQVMHWSRNIHNKYAT
jgi:hypothetical protein